MTTEIRKRPFVRPLFIWITGIILQTYLSVQYISFGLLAFPFLIMIFPQRLLKKDKPESTYNTRWIWGSVFIPLLLFLSIQFTVYHENKPQRKTTNKVQVLAKEIQQQLLLPLENLSLDDTEKAVLATITLGYKESIPKKTRQQFSITGVAHILAISGYHVAIVCGFLSALLSFLSISKTGEWVKYILLLSLLWTFATISGLAASAVRAAIMLSLYLTGRQLRRTTDSYNTLAASAFCMLVYNPFYLFDIGFQLSYIAVFFILFLEPEINRLIRIRNPLIKKMWGCITVTLAAQIGVTFLCLYYFGLFSSVFIFTNIPITVITSILIPITLIWIFLYRWLPEWDWIQYIIESLTHLMVKTVDAFSKISGSSFVFHFSFLNMILGYILLFILLLYYKKHYSKSLVNKNIVHLESKI